MSNIQEQGQGQGQSQTRRSRVKIRITKYRNESQAKNEPHSTGKTDKWAARPDIVSCPNNLTQPAEGRGTDSAGSSSAKAEDGIVGRSGWLVAGALATNLYASLEPHS